MTYDSKCYELAQEFLEDSGVEANLRNTHRLACAIQQAIEDEIDTMEKEVAE